MRWARANLKVNNIQCENMGDAFDILQVLVKSGRATPWREDDWMELEMPTKEELFTVWNAKS